MNAGMWIALGIITWLAWALLVVLAGWMVGGAWLAIAYLSILAGAIF